MNNLPAFIVYTLATTFTPGPNNIMSMVNGMHYSYLKNLRFLCGIFSGFFVVMFLCGMLNIALSSLLPVSEHWLKIAGALYMLYLAWHILRANPVQDENQSADMNSFRFGFGLQFINVKVILYGLSTFSMFIIPVYKDAGSMFFFAFLLAAVGFAATSSWAIGGTLLSGLLNKNYRLFNGLMAALLVYSAVSSLL
ncbi:MAG: LysE family transporter [Anaerolineae bacterium]|nr:LysE family transporter [Anaerolineae bacterium]